MRLTAPLYRQENVDHCKVKPATIFNFMWSQQWGIE